MMSLSKAETAQMHLNRKLVVDLIRERGPLMLADIIRYVPGLKRSAMGHMIRLNMIVATESGERDRNYNMLMVYSIPGEGYTRQQVEAEKVETIADYWPVQIPQTNAKPRQLKLMDERHTQSGILPAMGGLQSSMSMVGW